jgi:hypothetical protein
LSARKFVLWVEVVVATVRTSYLRHELHVDETPNLTLRADGAVEIPRLVAGSVETVSAGAGPAGLVGLTVVHGSDASALRPVTDAAVYWKGTVPPANGAPGDIWYDSTGD